MGVGEGEVVASGSLCGRKNRVGDDFAFCDPGKTRFELENPGKTVEFDENRVGDGFAQDPYFGGRRRAMLRPSAPRPGFSSYLSAGRAPAGRIPLLDERPIPPRPRPVEHGRA